MTSSASAIEAPLLRAARSAPSATEADAVALVAPPRPSARLIQTPSRFSTTSNQSHATS
jgi:hypothetical protein